MWISSFFLFWKNAWNVFDFVVTILSLIPETVVLVGVTSHSVWLQLLRICRVLRDLLNSLVTVFILFTMDHWYALLQDTWKVPEVSRAFSSIYVILWLLLGSIIFRNIIVAMMEMSVNKRNIWT